MQCGGSSPGRRNGEDLRGDKSSSKDSGRRRSGQGSRGAGRSRARRTSGGTGWSSGGRRVMGDLAGLGQEGEGHGLTDE